MDRVGDVVGEVHDLRFEAASARGRALAHPGEDAQIVAVDAVLARGLHRIGALPLRPGVLADRIEGRAGEVEARGLAAFSDDLRFEPRDQSERLGVALESPAVGGEIVEDAFAVVPEGRVAEVVAQAGGVDDVGVGSELFAEFAPDLGDFEGVGEAGADEVVGGGPQDLGLLAQAAKARGVEDARPVAFEGRAHRGFRGLRDSARLVGFGVDGHESGFDEGALG